MTACAQLLAKPAEGVTGNIDDMQRRVKEARVKAEVDLASCTVTATKIFDGAVIAAKDVRNSTKITGVEAEAAAVAAITARFNAGKLAAEAKLAAALDLKVKAEETFAVLVAPFQRHLRKVKDATGELKVGTEKAKEARVEAIKTARADRKLADERILLAFKAEQGMARSKHEKVVAIIDADCRSRKGVLSNELDTVNKIKTALGSVKVVGTEGAENDAATTTTGAPAGEATATTTGAPAGEATATTTGAPVDDAAAGGAATTTGAPADEVATISTTMAAASADEKSTTGAPATTEETDDGPETERLDPDAPVETTTMAPANDGACAVAAKVGCPAFGSDKQCPVLATTRATEKCETMPTSTHPNRNSLPHPVKVCHSNVGYVVSAFVKSDRVAAMTQNSKYYNCKDRAGGGWGAHQSSMVNTQESKTRTTKGKGGDIEGAKWKKTGTTTGKGYFFFPNGHTYDGYSNCVAVCT